MTSFLTRVLIPSGVATLTALSNPNYLPKAPSVNIITLGIRTSIYNLGGYIIESTAVMHENILPGMFMS